MRTESFEEACERSISGRAVADITIDYKGSPHKAEIVKPRNGDATIQFRHTALPIRKATTAEVDSIRQWRPY